MKRQPVVIAILVLATLALAACGASRESAPVSAPDVDAAASTVEQAGISEGEVEASPGEDRSSAAAGPAETLIDEQGAVVVSATPLNLGQDAATLDFEVALNTHSVDLSMDLSTLATLTTDAGVAVAATTWNAPSGGHHVSGVLSFPVTADGAALLDGATRITLTLEDLDAPARTFVWTLN